MLCLIFSLFSPRLPVSSVLCFYGVIPLPGRTLESPGVFTSQTNMVPKVHLRLVKLESWGGVGGEGARRLSDLKTPQVILMCSPDWKVQLPDDASASLPFFFKLQHTTTDC